MRRPSYSVSVRIGLASLISKADPQGPFEAKALLWLKSFDKHHNELAMFNQSKRKALP